MNYLGNELCLNDVKSALEAYDDTLATYPRYDIERKTGIRINANKRNYRKQSVHLEIARRIQEVIQPNWRNGNGRKSKKNVIKDFIKENPSLSVTQISKKLDVSRTTVYKYKK